MNLQCCAKLQSPVITLALLLQFHVFGEYFGKLSMPKLQLRARAVALASLSRILDAATAMGAHSVSIVFGVIFHVLLTCPLAPRRVCVSSLLVSALAVDKPHIHCMEQTDRGVSRRRSCL